jgi:hypothetical protein
MADLRTRIAALSPAQRARLESRVAALFAGDASRPRIGPRDRARPTPLGIAQQREWAISRLRGANNVPGAFRVEGEVDLDRLGRVLTALIDRHEVLRSTVEIGADGTPAQVVRPVTPVPVPVVDLSDVPPAEQPELVRAVCRAELLRPFPPESHQRLRFSLIRLARHDHVCVLITDHAASDAWSLAILIREIATLYGRGGDPADLPRSPIQFGDFAAWQRGHCDAAYVADELRHWRQTLAGIPETMALPADRPWPARTTYAGDVHAVDLPVDLVAEIRRFSERENVSLFPILLAASSVLLYRHLDQEDLVIGSLVSGRTRVDTEDLVGCFANPLPLRMRMAEDHRLRDVVAQARDTLATALDHQDVPFDRLIEELGLARESAQTSLSRMWINVITVPNFTLDLPGLRFAPAPLDLGLASVDLTLSAIPEGDRLRLEWQYMTELFDADTVALLADQFEAVLRQVLTLPDRAVDDVEFAAAAPPESAPAAGVVELFARRAALTPYAAAVVGAGTATTYAELNRAADRPAAVADGDRAAAILTGLAAGPPRPGLEATARDLVHRLGLGAGDRILAIAPPGAEPPVTAVLAAWLAGGAVALDDPSGPDDLAALVERERITVVALPAAAWPARLDALNAVGGSLRSVVVMGERPDLDGWAWPATPVVAG